MRNLETFLRSPIVNLNFAGFRANTMELQSKGWEISGSQSMTYSGRFEIQLMLQHEGGGLNLVSKIEMYDLHHLMDGLRSGRRLDGLPEMQVIGCSLGERSYFIPKQTQFMDIDFTKRDFFAVDPAPSFEKIDLSTIDLRKFGVFKKLNDSANIFLPEKTVDELMSEILAKQAPLQAEIRKNRKREEFMSDFSRNANDKIKLQLVAI